MLEIVACLVRIIFALRQILVEVALPGTDRVVVANFAVSEQDLVDDFLAVDGIFCLLYTSDAADE